MHVLTAASHALPQVSTHDGGDSNEHDRLLCCVLVTGRQRLSCGQLLCAALLVLVLRLVLRCWLPCQSSIVLVQTTLLLVCTQFFINMLHCRPAAAANLLPQVTARAAHLFIEVCAQGLAQSHCCCALALTQGGGGDAAHHNCRTHTHASTHMAAHSKRLCARGCNGCCVACCFNRTGVGLLRLLPCMHAYGSSWALATHRICHWVLPSVGHAH